MCTRAYAVWKVAYAEAHDNKLPTRAPTQVFLTVVQKSDAWRAWWRRRRRGSRFRVRMWFQSWLWLCHRLFAQEFNMSNSTYAILPTPENQQLPTRGAYAAYATLQNTQHQPTQHIMQFPFQLKGIVSKKNDAHMENTADFGQRAHQCIVASSIRLTAEHGQLSDPRNCSDTSVTSSDTPLTALTSFHTKVKQRDFEESIKFPTMSSPQVPNKKNLPKTQVPSAAPREKEHVRHTGPDPSDRHGSQGNGV